MITTDALNKNLLKAEYAVRGPIVIRAQQLEEQGCKIIYCNIGNPQALKQQPLTYLRQVLSLLEYPALLNNPAVMQSYPKDIVEKVRLILKKNPSGTGAYTQSAGIPFIRQAVADFIHAATASRQSKNGDSHRWRKQRSAACDPRAPAKSERRLHDPDPAVSRSTARRCAVRRQADRLLSR